MTVLRIRFAILYLTILCGIIGSDQTAFGAVLAGPITNPSNGNSYYLLTQNNWTGSESEAVGLGGHLVTINDAAEDAWVTATFTNYGGSDRALWIGFTDEAVEGTFAWISGEPVTYTNWSLAPAFGGPEPNNEGGNEDWAHIFPSIDPRYPRWNDAPNANNNFGFLFNGVVEVVVPEPTSVVLFASTIAATSAIGVRRRTKRRW